MRSNLILAIAALCLMIAGCTGDPLTQDNGRGAVVAADAGNHTHSDVGGQQPKQDVAVCTPKCGGKNCGDNGCGGVCGACDSDEMCNGASLCTPKSVAHACSSGSSCDSGERCWCDANGQFTCYALTGMCVTSGGKETCESTSSYTSSCSSGTTCVGADMSVKSAMCSADLYGCKKTGCTAGLFCNSSTGKCETDSSPGGSGVCVIRELAGNGFTAYGSGVSSLEMAEAGWSAPAASTSGNASLTVGGASYLSFNAQRADGLWAYGWDGISATSATKVVGNWQIDCGGISSIKLLDGPQQPTCGSSLGIGGSCLWSKPGQTGKYRVIVRLK
jgi:hypothetical protein